MIVRQVARQSRRNGVQHGPDKRCARHLMFESPEHGARMSFVVCCTALRLEERERVVAAQPGL